MPTTVYIAGPMQGYRNFNYDAFDEAARLIRDMGAGFGLSLDIINPADNFERRQDLPYETYLQKSLEQVALADVIVLLKGWQESEGVKRELEVAFKNGANAVPFQEYTGVPSPQNEVDVTAYLPSDPVSQVWDDRIEEQYKEAVEDNLFGPHGYAPCDCGSACSGDGPEIRIVDEAWALVMGDRQSNYGHPEQDFKTTGRMWSALIDNWLHTGVSVDTNTFPDIPPKLVALMMTCLKLSRESHAPKPDNRIDGIGYLICADRIEEGY